ncbi:MAG: ABC transporter ATP-binding protein [Puniceicoccales bacterium]|jgi:ABC-type dipeptide/oligopeptide/nickel transport system ATPase component|nr:ABC transporter ATP-binding protein [Puniceicoccales bacterium]
MHDDKKKLLDVRNLNVIFKNTGVVAINNISFYLKPREIFAIVGESGSGKTSVALSITNLFKKKIMDISGHIMFEGTDLLSISEKDMATYRGNKIMYIFQEPNLALNPSLTIGYQISESMKPKSKRNVINLMAEVGLTNERTYHAYPYELSGGMQQRAMIAIALASKPKLLIADEPTTSLDVTIQKQIMDLLKDIRKRYELAILLITHNFGIINGFADRAMVMLNGKIEETNTVDAIFKNPKSPYTAKLLACVPELGNPNKLNPK